MDREYNTGARRDSRSGKGRYDLISPHMLERLAKRMEHGASIYGDRNWEKGIPIQDFYDSAMRHLINWQKGMTDEDHLAAAVFNVMGMIHFDTLDNTVNNICVCLTTVSKDGVNCGFCDKKLLRASVSHSKPLTPPSKVFVPIPSKDGLGGDTARQTLYDQHSASETAEMIRREEYRETYRHVFPTLNEQLTLEGLAKYD